MIVFIQKYQKVFFGFIAAIVIFSLLFLGTFSTLVDGEKIEDPIVGQTVDGASFRLSEVKAMARFIGSDREDAASNFCNDGVIRHDLLDTGLAQLLIGNYFEPLKKDLETRSEKAKKFRPYKHPQVEGLSAEIIWNRFLPELSRNLAFLRQQSEITPKTFDVFVALYQAQNHFSSETLRRVLQLQEQRYQIPPDPRLHQGDLSLFGFHSVNDWFGSRFVDLSAQFILNGAALAEQKGYVVSLEEAKGSLYSIFAESIRTKFKEGASFSLSQHLRSLGFDLNSAAKVWRKVLLFRRCFQGVSQSSFIDRLPFSNFAGYAQEKIFADLYQWPSALRLKNFHDLIEFQIYLSAIAPSSKNPLALPETVFSQEIIEKNFPELVPSLYQTKVREVSLAEAALLAPIKQVWDWELDEKNWEELQQLFHFIPSAKTKKERAQILGQLNPKNRSDLDRFVRINLLKDCPEWLDRALACAPLKEMTLAVAENLSVLPHVEQGERFASLLASAAREDGSAQKELLNYSDDKKTAYRIEDIKSLPRSVLTFAEARKRGILTQMADRILESEYLKIRKDSPAKFQNEKGDWKSFYEVKEIVAKHVFKDLLKSISSLEKKEWTDADYAVYRLLAPARWAQEDLKKKGTASTWLLRGEDPLLQQFKLEEKEIVIQRTGQEEWMKTSAFAMLPEEWSPIHVPSNGDISFFYLSRKQAVETPILEQIFFGKETLGADAQRYMAERFLESVKLKKSIIIPLQGDLE